MATTRRIAILTSTSETAVKSLELEDERMEKNQGLMHQHYR